jgi:hypothetical protein
MGNIERVLPQTQTQTQTSEIYTHINRNKHVLSVYLPPSQHRPAVPHVGDIEGVAPD